MRSTKMFMLAVAAILSLAAMASSASATTFNWNPQTTNTGPFTGQLRLTTGTGASVTCDTSVYARATGSVATTTNSAGTATGPVWSNCTNTISSGLATTVTSSSAWTLTANSLTAVTVTNGNAVIRIGGICTITATGVTVTGNVWNNTAHSLTAGSGSFAISESGLCDGATTGRMSGTVTDSSRTATIVAVP